MAATNHSANSATPAPSAPSAPAPLNSHINGTNGTSHIVPDELKNFHHHHHHQHVPVQEPRPAPTPASAANSNKKGKGKKAMDSNEASKLVAARISQLEVDTAAEREQEAEIDREVRKANRELASHTAKMNDLDKIDHLTKRCSELFASMKRLERDSVKNKKRADQLQKDKDTSRNEVTKQTTLKEKLEKLCRELQRENNKLKVDHRTLQDTHSKLKKDSDKRLEEVFKTLEGYQEEKDNPRKQVMNTKVEDLFKNRFKSLIDQYDLRDLHFHSHMRNKEIEVQWNMARYEEQKKVAETETVRSRQLNGQVQTFSKTETELRNQLNVYVDKFKQEMEDMSKKTKKLEKENDVLKRKVEARNSNIIKMADEQQKKEKDLKDTQKKNEKLTSIINQMQQQGRGIPQGMQGSVESGYGEGDGAQAGELEDGEEESDYNDEYEEGDDEESEEGEFDDDTEEEVHEPAVRNTTSRTAPYGPDPPPAPTTKHSPAVSALTTTNGHR